ncbi:MarR family winged helix-turn-helix transcriptional regulator [Microbacterium caowuchunii]|uniref:Winged helix-turn-helix transcriptional regulator n=1 Tax=Microbacterium caowuchunii TaxID=2614638 RepID=A0A5N0TK17_9MICO|nr:MarR family winged helix-turn-helix transcriptional regulator [Microbacterium caowuchunii]KAA9134266.1 winged helix-turn-helix transcriptional regulator [Microbacterium caowuchunii]
MTPAETEEPEPQRHTGYLIRRAQQAHVAAWTRLVSTEITSVQYSILVTLERLGEASQRVLCDEIDLDRSTIATLVARMERKGLIERRRAVDDARRNTVTLTPLGLEERHRLRPLVNEMDAALTGMLTAVERDQLRQALGRILRDQPVS